MVRLVDDSNAQVGIVDRFEAIEKAREVGLDLVEVAPNSDPPVCRIMDYGKWLYEQKRKQREAQKKQHLHSMVLKEIRIRPETDPHDLEIKVKQARSFLEKGHKVQFTVVFRGRQMLHKELSVNVLARVTESLQDVAKVDQGTEMQGRRMRLLFVPNQ
jgi:translation initiation factor IF-3